MHVHGAHGMHARDARPLSRGLHARGSRAAQHAAAMEPVMAECTAQLVERHPSVRAGRAIGLFGCLDLVGTDGKYMQPLAGPPHPAVGAAPLPARAALEDARARAPTPCTRIPARAHRDGHPLMRGRVRARHVHARWRGGIRRWPPSSAR